MHRARNVAIIPAFVVKTTHTTSALRSLFVPGKYYITAEKNKIYIALQNKLVQLIVSLVTTVP
jgi:hypothetical protein